jgi:SAM-dependent methyltransferase
MEQDKMKQIESEVKKVYGFCPPTKTSYASPESREDYRSFWGRFLMSLGLSPEDFKGQRVLDVGCGSCEKASFYHDWGAKVTGVDITPEVLALAREVVGAREIELVQASLFDYHPVHGLYDIVISDGVLHHSYDTFAALGAILPHLRQGGILVFSVVNVWGTFWWFRYARWLTSVLGGGDYLRRAQWGKRLFRWIRRRQEGTSEDSSYFRSEDSWAYDWFANPRWNLHSPEELLQWLGQLGLEHLGSTPSITSKEKPRTPTARCVRKVLGTGTRGMKWYWLVNREPNMAYISAIKKLENQERPHVLP